MRTGRDRDKGSRDEERRRGRGEAGWVVHPSKISRKFPSGEEALIKRWPLGVEWMVDGREMLWGRWFKDEYEGSSREFRCKEGKVWRVSRLENFGKIWKEDFMCIYFIWKNFDLRFCPIFDMIQGKNLAKRKF